MDKELFEELEGNLKQAIKLVKGEAEPSSAYLCFLRPISKRFAKVCRCRKRFSHVLFSSVQTL